MKYWIYIFSFIVCASCQSSQPDAIEIQLGEDIVVPKHYIVTKTTDSIVIDGKASEPSWAAAQFTDKFIDIEGVNIPKFDTQGKLLWDDNYLYIYAQLEEPHIWGTLTERDAIIYYNNDFEVFIDPSGTGYGYGEIEINALNTVWDLYLNKPYRVGGNANFEWNLNELKTEVYCSGSLNNPSDTDALWTVEMAIPLKPFVALKNRPKTIPKEGEQWRINFSRVQWDHDLIDGNYYRKKENGKYLREYNWVWSNQKVINMHEPEKWGFLQFTELDNSDDVSFIQDKDLEIKQLAFALFRKTRYGDLKYLLDSPQGSTRKIIANYSETDVVEATFFKTNFGFEYELKSPKTEKVYYINQEGKLKEL